MVPSFIYNCLNFHAVPIRRTNRWILAILKSGVLEREVPSCALTFKRFLKFPFFPFYVREHKRRWISLWLPFLFLFWCSLDSAPWCDCIPFFLWRCSPTWARASSFLRFLDHTQRRTTVGRIPLDGWSARRRELHLKTHNNHNRQTSMPPVGFEPTISAVERP